MKLGKACGLSIDSMQKKDTPTGQRVQTREDSSISTMSYCILVTYHAFRT